MLYPIYILKLFARITYYVAIKCGHLKAIYNNVTCIVI